MHSDNAVTSFLKSSRVCTALRAILNLEKVGNFDMIRKPKVNKKNLQNKPNYCQVTASKTLKGTTNKNGFATSPYSERRRNHSKMDDKNNALTQGTTVNCVVWTTAYKWQRSSDHQKDSSVRQTCMSLKALLGAL